MAKDVDIEFGSNRIKIDLDPIEWIVVAVIVVAVLFYCDTVGIW